MNQLEKNDILLRVPNGATSNTTGQHVRLGSIPGYANTEEQKGLRIFQTFGSSTVWDFLEGPTKHRWVLE